MEEDEIIKIMLNSFKPS